MALLAVATASSAFSVKNFKGRLTPDFLTGFESGIFMRDNADKFKSFNCPEGHINSEEYKFFKSSLDSAKTLITAFKTPE